MGTINNGLKKYNTNIKKLFDAIIKLNAGQQTKVMNYVEELLTDNKRMSVRKPCDIPINYATQNRVYSDTITDISKNGLFIETNQALNVGEEIMLSFNMQGYDRPFKIKGKIARSGRNGVGVEFRHVNPYVAEMLGVIVERLNAKIVPSNQADIGVEFREIKTYVSEMPRVLPGGGKKINNPFHIPV